MGGQNHRMPFTVKSLNKLPQTLAQLHIDAGSGLIEHDYRRLVHQRLRHQHTTFHAARQTAHIGIGPRGQVQVSQNFIDPVVVVADTEVTGLDAQGFTHRKKRVEDKFLRHDTKQAARRTVIGNDIAAEDTETPGIGPHETGKAGNQRGLPGAIRAEQPEKLSLGNLQRNAVERFQATEALFYLLNGNCNTHGT